MSQAEAELAAWEQDVPGLILESGWFITKDEHRADGEYPFPAHPYCHHYLSTLCRERLVLVPKSRQVMITWLTAGYLVAQALLRRNLLAIYQTKREDDALAFMERVYFLYNHLPAAIRKIRPKQMPPKENKFRLEIVSHSSKIQGIPSGADVIRSNTVSIFVADEVNFQPEAKASLRAAGPSLGKTGQGIWISSANQGGLIPQLVKGQW